MSALVATFGHYVLTQEPQRFNLSGGKWLKSREWNLWVHDALPVSTWEDGWLLGVAQTIDGDPISGQSDFDIERQDGRWVFINLAQGIVRGGAGHFLGICHHTESGDVSSNPTLIGYVPDPELVAVLCNGKTQPYFPFGMTAHQDVRRVLAHHTLDLKTNTVNRTVWPDQTVGNVDELVSRLIRVTKGQIRYAASQGPIWMAFSGGTDSRILLALARDIPIQSLFTFKSSSSGPSLDLLLAKEIAKLTGLPHAVLPMIKGSEDQIRQYEALTGGVVLTSIREMTATRLQLPPSVEVSGVAGDLQRSYYQYPDDDGDQEMSPEYFLKRIFLPAEARLVAAAGVWLEELGTRKLDPVLNASYMENRVSSWGAPQSHFWSAHQSCAPFVTHTAYQAMLHLPRDYRLRFQTVQDICGREWPELLNVPINAVPKSKALSFTARKIIYRVKRKLLGS